MKRHEGFLTLGAGASYWIALGIALFLGGIHLLGKIAQAMGGGA